MAEIFKAEHHDPGQIRGHKVLLSEVVTQPGLRIRLLSEARTMARLRHPTIAEVHDFDVQGDSAFVVMEHVPGMTLHAWCDHVGKLARNPGLAAAIAGTLADGLAFAHEHGVVHRDLNPENVILIPALGGGDGFSLKIVDFGVARMVRDKPLARTRAGGNGIPFYRAPEQWRLESSVDQRADVYALGCILFELLCGRPPFCPSDDPAVIRAHLDDPPPDVTALEPEIPSRFQTLIARMLAKSADDRHPSMEDVLTELEAISGRRRSRWSAMLRTPREGTMAARGTLVINLELATIVDQPDLPARRLPDGRLLLQRLAKAEWLSRLLATLVRFRTQLPEMGALARRKLESSRRLLPTLARLRAQLPKVSALARRKLESSRRLLPDPARLRARLSVPWTFLKEKMARGKAPRLAVLVCAGALVAVGLLWATRALLTSNRGVQSGAIVPAAPLTGAPSVPRPRSPTADLPQAASERHPPPVQASAELGAHAPGTAKATSRPGRVRRAASPVASPTLQRSPPRRRMKVPAGLPHRDEGSPIAGSRQRDERTPSPPPTVYRAVVD
jgi:serine/threonine protein kinase